MGGVPGLAEKYHDWDWVDNPCPGCMDRFRKRYSHLVGGSFLAEKAAWALAGI